MSKTINDSMKTKGDPTLLNSSQRQALFEEVLPAAERWLQIPGLKSHAQKTLAYWGVMEAGA